MTRIIMGTTPTITYTFNRVSATDFSECIMTIVVGGAKKLEKTLDDATVTSTSVSWVLTQAETLQLGTQAGTMMVNWLTTDGVRGASKKTDVCGVTNHVSEVMT